MPLGLLLQHLLIYCSVLACLQLRVAGSGVTCCKEVSSNSSAVYRLSEAPNSNCSAKWDLHKKVIVDENGEVDKRIVQYFEPKRLILKYDAPDVLYHLECPHNGVSKNLNCTDPCTPENDDTKGLSHLIIFAIVITTCIPFILVIACVCWKRTTCCMPTVL